MLSRYHRVQPSSKRVPGAKVVRFEVVLCLILMSACCLWFAAAKWAAMKHADVMSDAM